MLKSILHFFVILIASAQPGAAPSVEHETRDLLRELQAEAPALTPDRRNEVLKHLREARSVLVGNEPGVYDCVDRDGTGAPPYLVRWKRGASEVRVGGTQFASSADCDTALSFRGFLGGGSLICIARDNDGRAPFQLAILRGIHLIRLPALAENFGECLGMTEGMRLHADGAYACVARADRMFVPVKVLFNTLADSSKVRVFKTLRLCNASL